MNRSIILILAIIGVIKARGLGFGVWDMGIGKWMERV